MPELGLPQSEFASHVRQDSSLCMEPYFVQKLAGQLGVKLVGAGSEAFLTGLTPQGDKLAAFTYELLSPEAAKALFWSQKLLATLFPHNFPKYYAAFGSTHSNVLTGTIREWIRGRTYFQVKEDRPQLFDPLALKEENRFVKYSLPRVKKTANQLGFDLDFDVRNWDNFLLAPNGGVYYLDKPAIFGMLDREAIKEYMDSVPEYSNRDKTIVDTSVGRLALIQDSQVPELKIK